jgi:hypothetical protein
VRIRSFRWVLVHASSIPSVLSDKVQPLDPFRYVVSACPDIRHGPCRFPLRDVVPRGNETHLNLNARSLPRVGSGPCWNPQWFPQLLADDVTDPPPCTTSCLYANYTRRSHIPGIVRAGPGWRPRIEDLPHQELFPYVWGQLHANVFPYGGIVTTLAVTGEVREGKSIGHERLIELLRSLSTRDQAIASTDQGKLSARQLVLGFADAVVAGIFGESDSHKRRGDALYAITLLTAIDEVAPGRRPPYRQIAQLSELAPPGRRLAGSILDKYEVNDFGRYEGDIGVVSDERMLAYLPPGTTREGYESDLSHRTHDKRVLALLTHPAELALLQKVTAFVAVDEIQLARAQLREAQDQSLKKLKSFFRAHFLSGLAVNAVRDLLQFQEKLPLRPRAIYDAIADRAGTATALARLHQEIEGFEEDAHGWTRPVKKLAGPLLSSAKTLTLGV